MSIQADITNLGEITIEVSGFLSRATRFRDIIQQIVIELNDRAERLQKNSSSNVQKEQLEKIIEQVESVLKLSKNIIQKYTSKTEFVDFILKRGKYLQEFSKVSLQLQTILKPIQLPAVNTLIINPIIDDFMDEMDWQSCKNTLLCIKYHTDLMNDVSQREHTETINAILIFLNKYSIPFQELQTMSMLDLNTTTIRWLSKYLIIQSSLKNTSKLSAKEEEHLERSDESHDGFGNTFRCVWSGALVAVKKINPRMFCKTLLGVREAIFLSKTNSEYLTHSPYLAEIIGAAIDPLNNVYFIQQLAPLGTLHSWLHPDSTVNEVEKLLQTNKVIVTHEPPEPMLPELKLSILMDISMAVKHLHDHGIVHGRIKDTNIFLYPNGRAKLSDYGVHSFLTIHTRLEMKGAYGLRWTAPEVYQLECEKMKQFLKLEEMNANARNKYRFKLQEKLKFATLASSIPYALTPSSDIYAVGILAMVLLTEQIPFSNVPWEEGVKKQLLAGLPPTIVAHTYPDKEALKTIEDLIAACVCRSENRWTVSHVYDFVENIYCGIIFQKNKMELEAKQEDLTRLISEGKNIENQINEHKILCKKGAALIAKKDAEKLSVHNVKERREKETEIEKAKGILRGFESNLKGFEIDLVGVEEDKKELMQIIQGMEEIVNSGPRYALEGRTWMKEDYKLVISSDRSFELYLKGCALFGQDGLIDRYCTQKEREKIVGAIDVVKSELAGAKKGSYLDQSKSSVNPLKELVLHPIHMNSTSINSGNFSTAMSLSIATLLHTHHDDDNDQFTKGETIPLLESNPLLTATGRYGTLLVDPVLQKRVEQDTKDKVFEYQHILFAMDAVFRIFLTEKTLIAYDNPQIADPYFQYVSAVVMPTSKNSGKRIQFSGANQGGQRVNDSYGCESKKNLFTQLMVKRQQAISSSSSKSKELVGKMALTSLKEDSNSLNQLEEDTDDEEEDEEEMKAGEKGLDDDDEDEEENELTNEFDEYDMIHVQYLAASRGHWKEAIGIRKNAIAYHNYQNGLTDEAILLYLDRNHTPIHITATLGHFDVMVKLIKKFSLNPNELDDKKETPLHYACQYGHIKIVQYLVELMGANIFAYNMYRLTPIEYTFSAGYLMIARYFIELAPKKIDSNYRDIVFGASLLHWACLSNNLLLIKYLLKFQKLPVELKAEKDGTTCLLWACATPDSFPVVQYLIEEAKANPKAVSRAEQTCLHMAASAGCIEVCDYLLNTIGLKLSSWDNRSMSAMDCAVGKCLVYLKNRK